MLTAIAPQITNRDQLVAPGAKAQHLVPVSLNSAAVVSPEPDQIREIARGVEADMGRDSGPDLQALLEGLLQNFGTDNDLPDSDVKDSESREKLRDNRQGAAEAIESMEESASEGEQTVALHSRLENNELQPAEAKEIESECALRGQAAEGRSNRAEELFRQAQVAETDARTEDRPVSAVVTESNRVFGQKAAAAESAARVEKVMLAKEQMRASKVVARSENLGF